MRAAVSRGPGKVELDRVPVPEPGPGEVRVRVRACGICGSDLHFRALGLIPPGVSPGHETAGEVDAVGEGVRNVAPGDPVVVEPMLSCGECPSCRAGRDSICPQLRLVGLQASGGFAERMVVPERRIFRVPRDLEPAIAALAEPTAVVVHGLRRGGFEPGSRVLVVGAGTIGLLTVVAARAMGASETLITARHPHQAELARALGASRVLREEEANPFALAELGRAAPIDLAVETVGGTADTLGACSAAIRPGGTISVLGVFTQPVPVEPFSLLMKEGTLAWSNCYAHGEPRADFDDAIELLDAHRETLARLITHRVPLDAIEDAYRLAADKKAGAVKVSVAP